VKKGFPCGTSLSGRLTPKSEKSDSEGEGDGGGDGVRIAPVVCAGGVLGRICPSDDVSIDVVRANIFPVHINTSLLTPKRILTCAHDVLDMIGSKGTTH
jgi:hypothetical protein